MNINLSKGWALTLGVFLGYQVARLQDKLPFVMRTLNDIREATTAQWSLGVPHESIDADEDDDE